MAREFERILKINFVSMYIHLYFYHLFSKIFFNSSHDFYFDPSRFERIFMLRFRWEDGVQVRGLAWPLDHSLARGNIVIVGRRIVV